MLLDCNLLLVCSGVGVLLFVCCRFILFCMNIVCVMLVLCCSRCIGIFSVLFGGRCSGLVMWLSFCSLC